MSPRRLILLGPQPQYQTLAEAVKRLGDGGRIALVTAGWEEDESDDQEIHSALGGWQIENLALFKRSEHLFANDPEFIKSLQKRQDDLRELRNAYQIRLEAALGACRKLIALPDGNIGFDPEREMSVDNIRRLDRQYFFRTSQIIDQYEEQLNTAQRPSVVFHRQQLAEIMANVDVLVISGGNTAIILNRLKIFGILDMQPEIPIVACSGGAMALADQIVFFHDSPPQGPGDPELLRPGMGLYLDILPFPDGKNRLQLDDRERVALMARRFEQFACVILDERSILDRQDKTWLPGGEPLQMKKDGSVQIYQP